MSWKFIKDAYRKARKEHICFHCAETIEKGSIYYYIVCTNPYDNNRPFENKKHIECELATEGNIYYRQICIDECLELGMFKRGTCNLVNVDE